ncbi:uncharacterized protein METZ01_LOCUS12082 [marine metagenome]|mgnify:FL=1|uniref:Thioredoxin domain-containing protein n=1 Tax=marine metagenome TaxID=408172 RepID=A0A381NZ92_9ZZZZ|tara:strand:+ start:1618 stop:2493 length:876 start_codon:yes stop_codon:yes gene_type:complete
MWRPGAISRRSFFALAGAGFGAAVVVAACGSQRKQISEVRTASKWFSDQTIVANQGPQRTIWSFSDGEGNLGGLSPESIEVAIADAEGRTIHQTMVGRHVDGVAMPYYPVIVPFQTAGMHEFQFDLGRQGRYVGYAAPGRRGSSTIFWPGDRFPEVQTPTASNSRGVDPICTRSPACPFHEVSLDDSLASTRATLLIVSTPAFCGTKWMCGPVLENLIDHVNGGISGLDVIHAEVYANPSSDNLGPLSPMVEAAGVSYEPFMFLLDERGVVLRRLDHIWDNAELRDLLLLA